jgi:hypothetical protein
VRSYSLGQQQSMAQSLAAEGGENRKRALETGGSADDSAAKKHIAESNDDSV